MCYVLLYDNGLGSFDNIHDVVAKLLAFVDIVDVEDAHLVAVDAIVDIGDVLVAELLAIVVDFVLGVERHVVVDRFESL